jgi:hypothetical protein
MEGSLVAYKVFTNGSTLQASEVNENLMQQVTATFSNAAARAAAITAPVEGQVTYLEDSNSYQYWNSSSWVGLVPQSNNAIINGAFDIWQRGTSFSNPNFSAYTADRFRMTNYNVAPTTHAITRETLTPGTSPFVGGSFFFRSNITTVGSTTQLDPIAQRIENVDSLAGQTMTLSFYAKSDSSRTQQVRFDQNFGTGGSSDVAVLSFASGSFTTTTSWQRFSFTFNVPSTSGKTVGANSFSYFAIRQAAASGSVLDLTGIQLEAGSVATPFRRNANSLQGELAACQRYFQVLGQNDIFGSMYNTTSAYFSANYSVTMRANASATMPATGSLNGYFATGGKTSATAPVAWLLTSNSMSFVSTGYTGLTANDFGAWTGGNIQLSAEL